MSQPSELQADALVQAVARQAAQQRRALLDAAEREAQAIAERARDKVRRQQQRAIEELRAVEAERRRRLQAALDTEARRQAALQARADLDRAWPKIRAALARRWADPVARAAWIGAVVALAASRLPLAGWTVRHPRGWLEADQAALQVAMDRHGVRAPDLDADAALDAGLIVQADGAWLDATPVGLLADPSRVEAAWLAELQRAGPTPP